uniref:Uncharacterized protein n=1 Tax=Talaromyces marneffei PM1 TaxID=1077442 RepID=A0A093XR95_TALMA
MYIHRVIDKGTQITCTKFSHFCGPGHLTVYAVTDYSPSLPSAMVRGLHNPPLRVPFSVRGSTGDVDMTKQSFLVGEKRGYESILYLGEIWTAVAFLRKAPADMELVDDAHQRYM